MKFYIAKKCIFCPLILLTLYLLTYQPNCMLYHCLIYMYNHFTNLFIYRQIMFLPLNYKGVLLWSLSVLSICCCFYPCFFSVIRFFFGEWVFLLICFYIIKIYLSAFFCYAWPIFLLYAPLWSKWKLFVCIYFK